MLKVLSISDKQNTAIDRLITGVAKYHDNLSYLTIPVHPKRPDNLEEFEKLAWSADVIDFQYFRTALMLLERFPWLKDKPKILSHNNPYSIYEQDWKDFEMVVANNKTMHQELEKITSREVEYVPLTVDTDFWTFKREFEPNKNVIMVANRIESKKGIAPVAIACGELGLRLKLVGAISDRTHFDQTYASGAVDFYEQISDEDLRELYWNSTIHVCNSQDNFESGTLPILESMLCGVPVLTRNVGHVPDLYNGENMVLQDSNPDDVLAIKSKLESMIYDHKRLREIREKAWQTAKSRSNERRAYAYQKLYRKLLGGKPVSVVCTIFEDQDTIRKCLNAIANQDYPNLELVVADDNQVPNKELVDDFARTVNIPVRYINPAQGDYGLARARNEAVVASTGEIIVICDQRQIMAPDAVSHLVDKLTPKTWVYGNKGSKRDFVENFSAVYRQDLIGLGMFCERMTEWGGLTQETRSRMKWNQITPVFVEEARAEAAGNSKNKFTKKDSIIRMKNRLWMMNE